MIMVIWHFVDASDGDGDVSSLVTWQLDVSDEGGSRGLRRQRQSLNCLLWRNTSAPLIYVLSTILNNMVPEKTLLEFF